METTVADISLRHVTIVQDGS